MRPSAILAQTIRPLLLKDYDLTQGRGTLQPIVTFSELQIIIAISFKSPIIIAIIQSVRKSDGVAILISEVVLRLLFSCTSTPVA